MQVILKTVHKRILSLDLSFDWSFELNRISHRHITMEASYVTIDKAVLGRCICWLIALIMNWLLSATPSKHYKRL